VDLELLELSLITSIGWRRNVHKTCKFGLYLISIILICGTVITVVYLLRGEGSVENGNLIKTEGLA